MNEHPAKLSELRFGPFDVDLQRSELRKHGLPIRLAGQSFQILEALVRRPGELVTREELRQALWPADTFVDFDHGLNAGVNRLREALGDSSDAPRWVQTVRGQGYRFIGQIVENGRVPETTSSRHPSASANGSHTGHGELRPTPPRPFLRRSLLFAAALAAVVGTLSFLRPPFPPPKLIDTQQLTTDGRPKVGPIATDGLRVYFTAYVGEHARLYAVSASGGDSLPMPTPFPDTTVLNISSDNSSLLVGQGSLDAENPLWSFPVLGGQPRRLADATGHSASWSTDGRYLAFANHGVLFVANADGTAPRKIFSSSAGPSTWLWTPTWSPDGTRLRFELFDMLTKRSEIWEIQADGKNLKPALSAGGPAMKCCGVWTPNGKYFVFDGWDGIEPGILWPVPNIWTVREGSSLLHQNSHERYALTGGPTHFFAHAISPDGQTIFATSTGKHGELVAYDPQTQRFAPYLDGVSVDGVTFSPDRQWIAYVKYPSGQLWRSRADGSQALQLTSRPLVAYSPQWSPDGHQLAFSAQSVGEDWHVYTVSANGDTPKQLGESKGGMAPTWSPDGNELAFVVLETGGNTYIRRLNLKTGKTTYVPNSSGAWFARWSPDGRYIAAASLSSAGRNSRLMLFDVLSEKLSDWVSMPEIGQITWSWDGQAIFFLVSGDHPAAFRLALGKHQPQKIADLQDTQLIGVIDPSISLTPTNQLLLLRNLPGGTEIYALRWDQR